MAMEALSADGAGNQAVLHTLSATMGISQDQLRATLDAVKTGDSTKLPPEILDKALEMQRTTGVFNAPTHNVTVVEGRGATDGSLTAEDEGQNWLMLYRRVYLRKADIYFGPVFTVLVAMLFWAEVLPFGVALWTVPVAFVLCVHLVLVHGG